MVSQSHFPCPPPNVGQNDSLRLVRKAKNKEVASVHLVYEVFISVLNAPPLTPDWTCMPHIHTKRVRLCG
jgi:hypothetical protein